MTTPTQINFVVVELFNKEGNINTKPELGLFRGLRLRTEKKLMDEGGVKSKLGLLNLILLGQAGQNNTLNGFSHDFYKVMSIRLGYGMTKEFMTSSPRMKTRSSLWKFSVPFWTRCVKKRRCYKVNIVFPIPGETEIGVHEHSCTGLF